MIPDSNRTFISQELNKTLSEQDLNLTFYKNITSNNDFINNSFTQKNYPDDFKIKNSGATKTIEIKKEHCIDKDFVSSDVVKQKVKAYEKLIKANDLKVIGGVAAESPNLVIDRNFPDSESSRLRKDSDRQFQLWKQLSRESLKEKSYQQASYFVQMKSLENVLSKNKYQPYLDFVQKTQEKVFNTALIENAKKKTKSFLKKKKH